MPNDHMTIRDAAAFLGVHRNKVKRLVVEGVDLPDGTHFFPSSWRNPLDRREVLILRRDVERIGAVSMPTMEEPPSA